MTGAAAAILFGVTGAITGILITDAAEIISVMKCSKKGTALDKDRRFTHPLLKLSAFLLNTGMWGLAGFWEENILSAFFLAVLFTHAILLSIIDLRIHIIPNELVLTMTVAGIMFQITHNGFGDLLTAFLFMIGLAALFTAAAALTGFHKIGAGDIKLIGAMGLTLGYPHIVTALLIMSIALIISCTAGLLTRRLTLQSMLPFAPFMMLGMSISLVLILFE